MPQIPIIDKTISEQQLSGTKFTVGASATELGAGEGRKLGSAINSAIATGIQIKGRYDDLAVQDADVELLKKQDEISLAVSQQKGKNSIDSIGYANENYNKAVDEISKNLSSGAQREKFSRIAGKRWVGLKGHTDIHTAREMNNYEKASTAGAVASLKREAVNNYSDPAVILSSLEEQSQKINALGASLGEPETVTKRKVIEAKSQTHMGVVTKMANLGAYRSGMAHLEFFKKDFTDKDFATAKKIVENGALRGESQLATDAIMSKNMTMKDSIARARKISDPKHRDETVKRVRARFSENESARRLDEEDLYRDVYNVAIANKSIDSIPIEQFARMEPVHQERVRKVVEDLKSGKNIQTDYQTFYDLEIMAGTDATKEIFAKTNLMSFRDRLSNSDFQKMARLQSTIRKSKEGSDQEYNGVRSKTQIVADQLKTLDVHKDSDEALLFRRKLDEAVFDFQKKEGRKANTQDIQKVADVLSTEVIVDRGFLWDTKKKLFELENEDFAVADIPSEDVKQIRVALERRGIVPTDRNVRDTFIKKQQRDLGAN